MKKYELTSETKQWLGRTLYRIRALVAFGEVDAGELGGWIEKESNLDQNGNAWVYGNARVYGNALVYGNARVYGNAWVYGNALVYGNAWVYGNARVYGDALVYGDAQVYGNAWVCGNALVCGNARVYERRAIMWISVIGSRADTVTFFAEGGTIGVTVGCFYGSIAKFEERVRATHGDNEHAKAYMLAIELAKLRVKVDASAEAAIPDEHKANKPELILADGEDEVNASGRD